MYIYDEYENDDNDDDDNNHNLIKQKKRLSVEGCRELWPDGLKKPGTPGQQPGTSGFSTLLVPVFIKTFINSICKILIKLIDLQIPSRPVHRRDGITLPTTTARPPSSTTRPKSFYPPYTQKTHPIEKSQSQIQKP